MESPAQPPDPPDPFAEACRRYAAAFSPSNLGCLMSMGAGLALALWIGPTLSLCMILPLAAGVAVEAIRHQLFVRPARNRVETMVDSYVRSQLTWRGSHRYVRLDSATIFL